MPSSLFQISLIPSHSIAPPPVFEHLRRTDFPRFFLIVCRVAPHPESLGEDHGRTSSAARQVGSESRGSVRIQDVVAVAGKTRDSIRLAPGREGAGLMPIQRRAKGDLIVLKDK